MDAGPTSTFVTADQPTANTAAFGEGDAPTEVDLYYPVSPVRAVRFTFDRPAFNVDRQQLSDEETIALNRFLAERADEQIYAASENALVQLLAGDAE